MRVAFFVPAVLLLACGDGRPVQDSNCETVGEFRCGWTRGTGATTTLTCHDGRWFAAGLSGENLCATSCDDVGPNTVSCGGVVYGRQGTTSGASSCDGTTEFACDILGGGVLACREGSWAVSTACSSGKRCVAGDPVPVCQ